MNSSTHTPPEVFSRTLKLLEELTSISSASGNLAGLEAAAQLYGKALSERGLEVEIRQEDDGRGGLQPVLYARGPKAQERYLLLIGHLDTVLDAVPPSRRDGRLLATGAIDMKGGLATFVGALDLLTEQGRQAPEDLFMVVVPDEEVAGHLSKRVMEDFGGDARGLWVLEPGMPQQNGESLVVARRGTFHWQLQVTGQGAHAGNGYWDGRSALNAAADWCLEIQKLAQPGLGPTVNAGRMVAGDESFVEDLASKAALVGTARQVNVVPNCARVAGEVRFRKRSEGEELERRMAELCREVAQRHGVEAQFDAEQMIPPLEPQEASRRWATKATEVAAAQGWHLEIEQDRGGISFPNFLPDPSVVPTLDGLGPVGDGMHTREEFMELSSLDRRIALLAELLAMEKVQAG